MDIYDVIKLFHYGAMIVWIGSGLGLLVLFSAAERWHDEADVLRIIKGASILGPALSVPSGLVVLLSGLGLVWLGGHGWDAWVVLSLLGIVVIFGFGAGVVEPRLDWATYVWERHDDTEQALDCGRRAMRVARLDQVIQFGILALMVTRPGWADMGTLAAIGIGVTVAAVLLLRPAAIGKTTAA